MAPPQRLFDYEKNPAPRRPLKGAALHEQMWYSLLSLVCIISIVALVAWRHKRSQREAAALAVGEGAADGGAFAGGTAGRRLGSAHEGGSGRGADDNDDDTILYGDNRNDRIGGGGGQLALLRGGEGLARRAGFPADEEGGAAGGGGGGGPMGGGERRYANRRAERLQQQMDRRDAIAAAIDERREREEAWARRKAQQQQKEEDREAKEAAAIAELRAEKKRRADAEYAAWRPEMGVAERGEQRPAGAPLPEELLTKAEALFADYLAACARHFGGGGSGVADDTEAFPLPFSKTIALDEAAAAFSLSVAQTSVVIESALQRSASAAATGVVACGDEKAPTINGDRFAGIFDERGKFILLTLAELEGISKFIRQRGRVSAAEITAECNRIISV